MNRVRTLEAVSIGTTAAAFAITVLLVSTGRAAEANPVALGLLDAVGWSLTGVLAIGVEAACFAYLGKHRADGRQRLAIRGRPLGEVDVGRLVNAGGVAIATAGVLDVAYNLYLLSLVGSDLGSFHVARYSLPIALVLLAGLVAFAREEVWTLSAPVVSLAHELAERIEVPDERPDRLGFRVAAVFFVLTIALAGVCPFVGPLGAVDHVRAESVDWSKTIDGSDFGYGIAVDEDSGTVFATSDGNIEARHAADGSKIWSTSHPDEHSYGVAYDPANDRVYFVTHPGTTSSPATLRAVSASDGAYIWNYTIDESASATSSQVVYEDGTIYASGGLNTTAVNPDGSVIWNVNYRAYGMTKIDNEIFIGQSGGSIRVLSATDGSPKRTFSTSALALDLVSADGTIYAGLYSGNVSSYETDGTENYDVSLGSSRIESIDAEESSKHLYAGRQDGEIYALEMSDGSTVWSNPIHSNQVHDLHADDSTSTFENVSLFTVSEDSTVKKTDTGFSASTVPDLSGHVTDQAGEPIQNATVVAYAATYSGKSLSESRQALERLADPTPTVWSDLGEDVSLLGNGGEWTQDDLTTYVSTHTRDALPSTAPWIDNPNLADTATIGVTEPLPVNQPIPLIAWDADASGLGVNRCLPGIGSEYDCQMPGKHNSDATIVIERIGPGGDIVDRSTVTTSQTSGGGYLDPDSLAYAEVELPAGFYYIHEEGAPKGLPRRVGTSTQIVNRYQENAEGQLADRAKEVRDEIQSSNLVRLNTSTNATGYYSFSVPDGTQVVTVQAYHAPALIRDAGLSPASITQQTILTEYNSAIQTLPGDRSTLQNRIANSSVYFPSATRTVEPPAQQVDIMMYELSAPPGANVSALQDQFARLKALLENGTFTDLPPALQQRLEELNSEELQELRNELAGLSNANSRLRERTAKLLAQQRNSSVSEVKAALEDQEKTNKELREEIGALRQALAEVGSTIDLGEPTVDKSGETVSLAWDVPLDLSESNVSVIAHYANGTSQVVSGKYLKTETSAVGADTVRLVDYPLSEDGPLSTQFSLRVASGNDYGERTDVVRNPSASGTLPRLDSVRLSSLTPGPDESVSVTVNPAETGSFRQITGATVYAPDGSTLNASNVSEGTQFSFRTAGRGIHRVEIDMETTSGEAFSLPIQVKALGTDLNRPPTVTARDSPLGAYALTSGQVERATIDTDSAGTRTTVTAQLAKGETPSNVDVHLEELTAPRDTTTVVSLVQGADQQALDQHIPVTIHYKDPGDSVLVWRNDEAIPADGSQLGSRRSTGNSLVVETYTEADGTVSVRKLNRPGFSDRASFWLDLQVQRIPLLALTPAPALATPAGVSA